MRGADVPFTPFALGFALIGMRTATASYSWTRPSWATETRAWLGQRGRASPTAPPCLARSPAWRASASASIPPDRRSGSSSTFGKRAPRVADADPCLLPKACKNSVEQQGARDAHLRDAVAVCRFLHWLGRRGAGRGRDRAVRRRPSARRSAKDMPDFRGESFPAISGAGEHGAIIHYRVTAESNRADQARTRST